MDLGEWRAAIARDPLAVVGLDSDGLLYPKKGRFRKGVCICINI